MKRPPKYNKDGSSTLRFYCTKFHENRNCHFALTFRFVVESQAWLLYENYDSLKLSHNHEVQREVINPIEEKDKSEKGSESITPTKL